MYSFFPPLYLQVYLFHKCVVDIHKEIPAEVETSFISDRVELASQVFKNVLMEQY